MKQNILFPISEIERQNHNDRRHYISRRRNITKIKAKPMKGTCCYLRYESLNDNELLVVLSMSSV